MYLTKKPESMLSVLVKEQTLISNNKMLFF